MPDEQKPQTDHSSNQTQNRPTESSTQPPASQPIGKEQIEQIVNDKIDLHHTYLKFAQDQIAADRVHVNHLIGLSKLAIALVTFVFAAFILVGGYFGWDRYSTMLKAADKAISDVATSSQQTLNSTTREVNSRIQAELDSKLKEPAIDAVIAAEVRRFTQDKIERLSAEQVRTAMTSSPQMKAAILAIRVQMDDRKALDELFQFVRSPSTPTETLAFARQAIRQSIELHAPPKLENQIAEAYVPACAATQTAIANAKLPNDCQNFECSSATVLLDKLLREQDRTTRLCTLKVFQSRGVFPTSARNGVWQLIREDASISVTLQGVKFLNSLLSYPGKVPKFAAVNRDGFLYHELEDAIKFINSNEAALNTKQP